ncbi:MAG TPA: hypothetical protein VHP61_04355, partial [Acidobacteriota bacterium]|nr:hypothetical protein [Acidobacteriota bacterium]
MEDGKKDIQNGGSRKVRALPLGLGTLAVALLLGGAVLSRSQNGAGRPTAGSGGVVGSPDRSGQNVNRKL